MDGLIQGTLSPIQKFQKRNAAPFPVPIRPLFDVSEAAPAAFIQCAVLMGTRPAPCDSRSGILFELQVLDQFHTASERIAPDKDVFFPNLRSQLAHAHLPFMERHLECDVQRACHIGRMIGIHL